MWSRKSSFWGKKKGEEKEKNKGELARQGTGPKAKYHWTASGEREKSLNILFLQGVYNPLLFLLETVQQQRMCEQIFIPREVLLSKDSCPFECFLWWREKWHGELYLTRWVYNTSREKHTGQSIKREIEDLYKVYFKICWKKKSLF